jgi:hypothetical protein
MGHAGGSDGAECAVHAGDASTCGRVGSAGMPLALDSIPCAVLVFNSEKKLQTFNKAASALHTGKPRWRHDHSNHSAPMCPQIMLTGPPARAAHVARRSCCFCRCRCAYVRRPGGWCGSGWPSCEHGAAGAAASWYYIMHPVSTALPRG